MSKKLTSVIKNIIKEELDEFGQTTDDGGTLTGRHKRRVKDQVEKLKVVERTLEYLRDSYKKSKEFDSGLTHLEMAIGDLEEFLFPSKNESEVQMKTEAVDSKSDKAVLEAFTDGSPLDGNKLSTDGITLNGHWMGGNSIAEWVPTKDGEKIKFNDLGSKVAQQIQKAIAKIAPSNWLLNGKGY